MASDMATNLNPNPASGSGATTNTTNADRAVVGVFDDRIAAERAVDALHQAGFAGDRIGFVLRGSDVARGGMIVDAEGAKDQKGAITGAATGAVTGGVLAAAGAMLLIPGAGPILAGGVIAAAIGGAIAGTAVGGILGAMTGLGLSEEEAKFYERHFNEGRAIVAVKPGARVADGADILVRSGGRHIYSQASSPVETGGVFSTP